MKRMFALVSLAAVLGLAMPALAKPPAFRAIAFFTGKHDLAHISFVREAVYPRLSPGAVCVLMDYHDVAGGDTGLDVNLGVKLACDDFLADKPEQIMALYGNQYSHGFFRKVA